MEFYPDGDLAKYVEDRKPIQEPHAQGIQEPHAQGICRQILLGLNFMHEKLIAHRDLKPAVGLLL